MWNPDFEIRNVTRCCNQFQHKMPDHCFVLQQDWKNSDPFCRNQAALLWPVPPVRFFLAGTIGRLDRLPHTLHWFKVFCEEQWATHVQALEESDRLTWSKVQEVKAKLHHQFVPYNEDHHPNHIVCYCPQFYMRSILTTWDDPATFESLQGSPERWQQEMPSFLAGTVFLKRKKQFQKGRTIISYAEPSFRMQQVASTCINCHYNYDSHIVP